MDDRQERLVILSSVIAATLATTLPGGFEDGNL